MSPDRKTMAFALSLLICLLTTVQPSSALDPPPASETPLADRQTPGCTTQNRFQELAVWELPGADLTDMLSRRYLSPLVAGSLLALASWKLADDRLDRRALDNTAADGLMDIGNVYGSGLVIGGGGGALMVAGQVLGERELSQIGSDVVHAYALSGALVWTLKICVDRRRPSGGPHSFPSGHTAAAFAAAPVLSQHLGPAAALPAYCLAVLTGAGRLEENKHHLADVTAGAVIGIIAGRVVAARRDHGLAPCASVGPGSIGLAWAF